MADTEKSEQPQTNGLENGLDDDERSKMRPADIDADVKEMERRKRVEMIMSSKLFREELERIIELQLKDGNGPAGLLQQISDMMGIQSGKLHTAHMFRGSNCVTPINDIRGVESMGYEKGEKNLRCKLASVFRLMDLYGWSQGINNQITARLNQDEEHFLVNPHGMLFNEITASSLVKVDMQGNIVEPGTTNFSVNTQGFLLHSAIHASRPDVNCVIHIKTPSVLAVSSLKCGLLPICQEALVIGEVSQHPFVSGIFEPEEREKIIRNLGPHNKVLLLHNHGAVCCGATIEEAFYNVYNTVLACETQMKLMPIGVENLLLVSDETRKQVYDAAHRAPDSSGSSDKKKFRVGEMEFEALIRMLDNAGFRTGYIYRHPLVKGELPKPKNDVEVPPAVSSLGYLIEQEELYKQGNWKKYVDGRNRLDRTKWLNSPNVYQKVEILETGTSDPKKITKWVAESSPTHSSTPVKIDSALQFVPKGTNPKEFKKLQQQIKENRRADKITSGPQSHILEGVSWEEAKKLQDANITQTGDQVILVGAASKGIIQRNYQHNALVYKTPYAKNPFDSMSDKEIEDYKQLVERKQRGDTDYEESQSESEAISSSRQDGLRHFKSPLLSPQSATSETEEESRDEPRVLRIETKTAPRPIQAEVVLSDAESDTTDARVERSHSARYPKAEKPESVTLMNSFRKSWSLKREKDKSKDVEIYDSRNLHSSLILKECEQDRMESLHYCVARIKELTQKPVIVDICTKALRPLLKSASDPCNLSTLNEDVAKDENRQGDVSRDPNTSRSCGNIAMSELQQRLHIRKRLLHSAKMKFLGYQRSGSEEAKEETPTSPMRALISEIRETISEIMSPERSTTLDEPENYFSSMRWIERPNFVSRSTESELRPKEKSENLKSRISLSRSFNNLNSGDERSETSNEFKSDFQVLKLDLDNSDRSDTTNCNCALHKGNISDDSNVKPKFDENQNEEKPTENIVTEIVRHVNASDEEATYTITDDSLLQTYSFTESTETEWYYNKTIMKLENSQTVLEIKEAENKENLEPVAVKYIDTGIDTDFTSEKENDSKHEYLPAEEGKEAVETTEDIDADAAVGESSTLNKSSETDSSFLKTSSGRTSNDVDTSFAFKTETENSDKSPEKSSRSGEEKKKLLEEMLLKTKEPIEEESSDSAEAGEIPEESEKRKDAGHPRLPDIPESPEFTNIDTEDAPVTSSSKDTSPDVAEVTGHRTEDEPSYAGKEQEGDFEAEKESLKPEHRRKKNVKSSTKITVKKELKEKDSKDPVVSEIRLTIKNHSAGCQSEKYEVKIQDLTNTSEDLSRSVSSADSFVQNVDSYESIEIMEKSCECEAQQNLEELQGEVTSTIEKLHTIEDYFEDEIKKHSSFNSERMRNGFDECTIEYNYREFEEVLNESQGEIAEKVAERHETPATRKNAEFFISSPLGDVVGEIEVCDDIDKMEMFPDVFGESTNEPPVMHPKNIDEDLAMSSAFVAAILSEAVMEREICTNGPQEFVAGEVEPGDEGGQIVIYNMEELLRGDGKEVVESDVAEFFADIIDGLKVEEATVETSDCLLMESDIGQQQPSEGNDSGHWEMPENIGEEQDLQMEEDRRFEKREPDEFVITEECLGFVEVSNTGQLAKEVIDSEENRQFVAERKDELTFISEVSEQKISECQLEEAAIIVSTEVVVTEEYQSREEYQYYASKDEIMAMEENCHLQNEHQFLAQNDAKNEQESNGQFPTEDKGPVLEEQLLKEIIEPVTEQQLSEEREKVVVERQHISEESDPTVVEQQQLLQENIEILIKRLPLENDQPVVEELLRENTEFITEQIPEHNNGLLVEKLNQENSDPIKMQLPEEIDKPVLVLHSSKGEGDHIQEQHLMEENDNDKEEHLQQNHGFVLGQLVSEENIRVRQQQKLVDENSGPTQGEQLPENKCGPVLKQQFPEESDSSIVKQQLPQKCNGTIPEDDTKTEPSIEKVVLVPEEELLEGNSGSELDLHLQNLVGLVSEENTVVLEEIKSSDENADTMLDEQKPEGKAVGPVLKQELPEGNDLIKTPVLEQQQQFLEVNNENSQEQQVLQENESPLVQKQLSSENVPVWEAELNEGNEGVLLREKLPKEMSGHTLKQQLSEGNDKHLLEEPLLEGNADVMVEQQLTEEINGHVLEVFPEEKGGPKLEQQFHKVSDIHLQEQLSQESDNSLMQHQLSSENAPVSEEQFPERDDVLVGEKLPEEMGEHLQKLQLPQENNKSMLEKQFPAESNDKPLTEQQPDSAKEQHKDTQQPFEDPDDSKVLRVLFPPQLKAIISDSDFDDPLSPIDHILNCLLNSVTHDVKNTTSVNDVINFLVTNEESPTESLAEFEDMENLISVSSSVIADIIDCLENQFEKEAESLPDEESKEGDGGRGEKQKKKRKGESMFKVTIATPAKKEIFINYSLDCSTTFNTSTDSADLCNSYIKTDDVNEDFENYSSDNPEFFSAASSGKTSLNNSFCSAESHVTAEHFCCVGCEDNSLKSPHFLAIIQEVDEDDSSTSSDAAAPRNPN